MLSQAVRGDVGQNQSSFNSDTGELLMRSTRALIAASSLATGSATGPVRLTIRKVSDDYRQISKQGKPRSRLRHEPDTGAPLRTRTDIQPGAPVIERSCLNQSESDSCPGHKLLTSHFEEGTRGLVLAALKQRACAPQRRNVKVQLLDPPSSRHDAQKRADILAGNHGDLSHAPVTAAAQMAQPEMACEGFQQGDITDRQRGKSGRSQVTVQHLEALHSRRLELQNQLLESALSFVTRYTPVTPEQEHTYQQVPRMSSAVNIDSSTRTSIESDPVTLATHTDQSRDACHQRGTVSVATQATDSQVLMEAFPVQTEARTPLIPIHGGAFIFDHVSSVKLPAAPLPNGPEVPSMLEEASRVLRQVQRRKKVLEENLKVVARVRSGEILHSQLKALVPNRDHGEQVRIKRTVDAWIHLIDRDVQAKVEAQASRRQRADGTFFPQQAAPGNRGPAHTGRASGARRKVAAAKGHTTGTRTEAEPALERPDDESYLTRVYGEAPRDGLRKSPYPRSGSLPLPPDRKLRPHLVPLLKASTKKDAAQVFSVSKTSLAPPLNSSPGRHLSSQLTSSDPSKTPAETAMAVPLAHPRIGPSPRCQQEGTSVPVTCSPVDHALPEPPSQQLQPVDEDEGEAPPPSFTVNVTDGKNEGEGGFPGSDFLCAADVGEDSVPEEVQVHLDGAVSPPPVLYQVLAPQDQGLHPVLHRDSAAGGDGDLVKRLALRVEQQLMSRMISDLYPLQTPEPQRNHATEPSKVERRSLTSAVVEAAGDTGLQHVGDTNLHVDSVLVKQMVHEVLAMIVTQVLGQREAPDPPPDLRPDLGQGPKIRTDPRLDPVTYLGLETEKEPGLEIRTEPGPELRTDQELRSNPVTEQGSELGLDPAPVLGSDPGTELESNPGPYSAPELESDPGVEQVPALAPEEAADPGLELVTDTAAEEAADPGLELGTDPAADPGLELGTNPAAEEAADPGLELVTDPTAEEAADPGLELVTDPGLELVTDPGLELVTDPAAEEAADQGLKLGTDQETEEAANPGPEQEADPGPESAPELVTDPAAEEAADQGLKLGTDQETEKSANPGPEQEADPGPESAPELGTNPAPEGSADEVKMLPVLPVPITASDPLGTPTSPDGLPPDVRMSLGDSLDQEMPVEHTMMQRSEEELATPPARVDPESSSSSCDESTLMTGSDSALQQLSEGELVVCFKQPDSLTESSLSSSLHDMDFDPPSEGQVKGHMFHSHTLQDERSQGEWWRGEEELSLGEVPGAHRKLMSQSSAPRRDIASCAGQEQNISSDEISSHFF
ncbi:protein TALPID3-like isoform X3 [Entelurus aequoreus]|uniref:protein TALPID3-like isoform X3 n=1 Tax=Entelurus aequoreus TaxID=161455 RepID=UPI002B1D0AFB|nr:protein TALPID3-like isoform X3 [Entelurus aequoreus]